MAKTKERTATRNKSFSFKVVYYDNGDVSIADTRSDFENNIELMGVIEFLKFAILSDNLEKI